MEANGSAQFTPLAISIHLSNGIVNQVDSQKGVPLMVNVIDHDMLKVRAPTSEETLLMQSISSSNNDLTPMNAELASFKRPVDVVIEVANARILAVHSAYSINFSIIEV